MQSNRTTGICLQCGEGFRSSPSARRKFCGSACYHAAARDIPRGPYRPLAERVWSKIHVGDAAACWPWIARTRVHGYGRLTVNGRKVLATHVVWELTYGPIPEGQIIRHLVCDTPPCCNPSHLALGDAASNVADMVRKGRQAFIRGERHARARLTAEQVLRIVAEFRAGARAAELARAYGVKPCTIGDVLYGRSWSHLTGIGT